MFRVIYKTLYIIATHKFKLTYDGLNGLGYMSFISSTY